MHAVTAARHAYADLRARLTPSRLPDAPVEPGDIRVALTLPWWTVYRSTDRNYIYGQLGTLARDYKVRFSEPKSFSYVAQWNADYLNRRVRARLGVPVADVFESPQLGVPTSAELVFAYGYYPRGVTHTPVLWEQTFAPQRGVDAQAWHQELRVGAARVATRAHTVVTATQASAESFAAAFPAMADKIRTVPYYLPHLDFDMAALESRQDDGQVRLVFVGKEGRRKGLDQFAAAWPLLPPDVRSRIQVQVISALMDGDIPLPEEWEFQNFVPSVLEAMWRADVLVFPTKAEAYGLVLVEAMAARCAVITCDAPIQRDIVGERAGLFVDPMSPVAIAGAIVRLASERAELLERQREARARFEAVFHPRVVGERYARLFSEVAGRPALPEMARPTPYNSV